MMSSWPSWEYFLKRAGRSAPGSRTTIKLTVPSAVVPTMRVRLSSSFCPFPNALGEPGLTCAPAGGCPAPSAARSSVVRPKARQSNAHRRTFAPQTVFCLGPHTAVRRGATQGSFMFTWRSVEQDDHQPQTLVQLSINTLYISYL